MTAGGTPLKGKSSKSPAPTPGKKTNFSIQNRPAKYGTGPKVRSK